MIDGTLVKIRVFQEVMTIHNRSVTVYYAMGLFETKREPVLQLSVVGKKSKLVKGDVSAMPVLESTEFGYTQMQMVAQARRRIMQATPVEIRAFLKGSFIQMQGVAKIEGSAL